MDMKSLIVSSIELSEIVGIIQKNIEWQIRQLKKSGILEGWIFEDKKLPKLDSILIEISIFFW